jgi:hypothetical protein
MTILTWILIAAAAGETAPAPNIEEAGLRQLLGVRRVYVDRLTGGETAAQMRELLISSLVSAKLFVITESQDRADAVLRGGAEDLVFTDLHASSEGINARANAGTGRNSRSGSGAYAGLGVGETESSKSEERKHEAVAAVRLVNKDGDVIWSTTQESEGGKFRRASTDVADRITKKLVEDYQRARKLK